MTDHRANDQQHNRGREYPHRAHFALIFGGLFLVLETLPLNAFWLMTNRIGLQGSVWFTTGEGEEMAPIWEAMIDAALGKAVRA